MASTDFRSLSRDDFRKELDIPNKTFEELINVLAQIKDERKFLDKVEKFLIEIVNSRREEEYDIVTPDGWRALHTLEPGRLTPDKDKIIADMGEEWFQKHMKEGEPFWVLKITKATAEDIAKAGVKPQETQP